MFNTVLISSFVLTQISTSVQPTTEAVMHKPAALTLWEAVPVTVYLATKATE